MAFKGILFALFFVSLQVKETHAADTGKPCTVDGNGQDTAACTNTDPYDGQKCTNSQCDCAGGYKAFDGDCKLQGKTCTAVGDCPTPVYDGTCPGSGTVKKCVCGSDYHLTSDDCKLGKACASFAETTDNTCPDTAAYKDQKCKDFTCVCSDNAYEKGGACVLKGKPCTGKVDTTNCKGAAYDSNNHCVDKVCECADGYYKHEADCVPMGKSCTTGTVTTDCPANNVNDKYATKQTCTSERCECSQGNVKLGVACDATPGKTCADTTQCTGGMYTGTCTNKICVCNTGYHASGTDCIKEGKECDDSNKATKCGNSERYDSTPTCESDRCKCASGFEIKKGDCYRETSFAAPLLGHMSVITVIAPWVVALFLQTKSL